MRPLETTFVLLVVIAAAAHLDWPVRFRRISVVAAIALGGLQALVEGFRWQLVPAVAVVLAAGVQVARGTGAASRRRLWASGAALAVLVPVLVPVPTLARPDGRYAVGTTTLVLEDVSRIEQYGPDPGGGRRLPLHVWYPASGDGESSSWLDREQFGAVAVEYGLPRFFLDHLTLVETVSRADVSAVDHGAPFPVIVYSHGWTGFGRISPDQPERLASHGYVVVAPDHTFGALMSDLPDGLVKFDPEALPDEEEVGEDAFDAAALQLVATYAADLRFVLDELAELDVAGLEGRLDLDRIGIFGHSTGGGAAVAACGIDPRCDAVFGLDPWVEPVPPAVLEQGLDQPFYAMRSEEWVGGTNDEVLFPLIGAGATPYGVSTLLGADHNDFVAMAQISPLASLLGFKGSISGPRAQEIIGRRLGAFFDAQLGTGAEMPEFPELRVEQ
jgi:pimeloyl-ACP methyl ester carboxylesterase